MKLLRKYTKNNPFQGWYYNCGQDDSVVRSWDGEGLHRRKVYRNLDEGGTEGSCHHLLATNIY